MLVEVISEKFKFLFHFSKTTRDVNDPRKQSEIIYIADTHTHTQKEKKKHSIVKPLH